MTERFALEVALTALEEIKRPGHAPDCVFAGLDGFPLDACDCRREKERVARDALVTIADFYKGC
jgi:hypothetical protein